MKYLLVFVSSTLSLSACGSKEGNGSIEVCVTEDGAPVDTTMQASVFVRGLVSDDESFEIEYPVAPDGCVQIERAAGRWDVIARVPWGCQSAWYNVDLSAGEIVEITLDVREACQEA